MKTYDMTIKNILTEEEIKKVMGAISPEEIQTEVVKELTSKTTKETELLITKHGGEQNYIKCMVIGVIEKIGLHKAKVAALGLAGSVEATPSIAVLFGGFTKPNSSDIGNINYIPEYQNKLSSFIDWSNKDVTAIKFNQPITKNRRNRSSKETVIVVHGTFSAKNNDCSNWYAPNQSFCRSLDKELEANGSAARCWNHLNSNEDFFNWDGNNDWFSRTKAANQLRRQVRKLINDGWIVHLVGHSHGGNIIIDAIMDRSHRVESWYTGRAVLLGTPIYSNSPSYRLSKLFRLNLWLFLSSLIWTFLTMRLVIDNNLLEAFNNTGTVEYNYALFMATISLLLALVLVYRSIPYLAENFFPILLHFYPKFRKNIFGIGLNFEMIKMLQSGPHSSLVMRKSPCFMLINSRFDEAYKSLSELRESSNPFKLDSTRKDQNIEIISIIYKFKSAMRKFILPIVSIGKSLEEIVKGTLNISRLWPMVFIGILLIFIEIFWGRLVENIFSMRLSMNDQSIIFITIITCTILCACVFRKDFGAACFFPGLVVTNLPFAIFKVTKASLFMIFDTIIKNLAWGFIKSFSLGINGSPNKAEDIFVGLELDSSHRKEYIYIDLPMEIVDRVKLSQKPLLSEIQELLYKEDFTWSSVALKNNLLKINFPMVHTVYYRETGCIKKMAAWICEPLIQILDGYPPPEIVYQNVDANNSDKYQQILYPEAGDNNPRKCYRYAGVEMHKTNEYLSHVEDLMKRYSEWQSYQLNI